MRPNDFGFETGEYVLVEARVVARVVKDGVISYCLELETDNGEPNIVDYVKAETLYEIPKSMGY